jgi:hypothetical protein
MTFDFIRVSELLKSCQMDGIKKSTQFFRGKIVVESFFRRINFSESSAVICVSSAL